MPGFLAGPLTGFVDRMKGKGMSSSSFLTQIGKSAAMAAGGGCISAQLSAAGIGNGADSTADQLFLATLPPNILDVAGRNIEIMAFGNTTNTSATKTALLTWGASPGGASITAQAQWTTTQTGNWLIVMNIWKTASNVQIAVNTIDAIGASTARSVAVSTSGTETDNAAIKVLLTGQCSSSVASAVVANGMVIYAYD